MTRLDELLQLQRELQVSSYGQDPAELSDKDKIEFIRWNILALEDELHEALGEVGWKPWATSRHINQEAFKGELVDAFHFFMNLMLVADISAEDLEVGYLEKRSRNAQRQQEGYDGVTDKCYSCGRDQGDLRAKSADHFPLRVKEKVFCNHLCLDSYTRTMALTLLESK